MGGALTDAVLCSQLSKAAALVEMLPDQPFPTEGSQGGNWGVYVWGVRTWALGSHHNPVDLIPLCLPEQPCGTTHLGMNHWRYASQFVGLN